MASANNEGGLASSSANIGGGGRGGGGGGGQRQSSAVNNTQGNMMNERSVDMTPELIEEFRDIFQTPYVSPLADLRESRTAVTGIPTVHQRLIINMEEAAFGSSPSSWRDLVESNTGNSNTAYVRDFFFMLASILCDETIGTGAAVRHGRQQAGDMGPLGIADLVPPPIFAGGIPGAGGNGHQQGGRGNGGGGGGGGSFDNRGTLIADGHGLQFRFGEERFPKAIACIEELQTERKKMCGLRLSVFVFDPELDLARAIDATIQRNAALYSNGRVPTDPYLVHYRTRSTNDFIERIALPYLKRGLSAQTPETARNNIRQRIERLTDANYLQQIGLSLSDPAHPANPLRIFSDFHAFALHIEHVKPAQRNPNNYFTLGNLDANDIAMIQRQDERASAAGHPEATNQDLYTRNDGLIVDDDEGGERDDMELDTAADEDDELGAILRRANMDTIEREAALQDGQIPSGSAATMADLIGADATVGVVSLTPEQQTEERLIGRYVLALRLAPIDAFVSFHDPSLVCRLSSSWFAARSIFNVPLPMRLRQIMSGNYEIANDGGTGSIQAPGDGTDVPSASVGGAARDENDIYFSDPKEDVRVLYRRRHEMLKTEMEKLPADAREEIKPQQVSNIQVFRDTTRELRMRVMHARIQERRAATKVLALDILNSATLVNYRVGSDANGHTAIYSNNSGVVGGNGRSTGNFLPEILSQRISQTEFARFASKNVMLQLRFKNHRGKFQLRQQTYQSIGEAEDAMTAFRLKVSREMWDTLLNSTKLSPALDDSMAWFKQRPRHQQWGEHLDIVVNLSTFANMVLKLLALYNGVFRGNTNQQAFIIALVCHYGTHEYDFSIKQNLLIMGKGSAGKSYLLEVIEVISCPGTFSSWSHTTDKAYSTGTSFTDQTFCMHEAPLSYIAVDKYGRSTLADPVLKDRLARQRSGTRSFAMDDNNNRITKDEQVMIMGNILMATNDMAPPDDSPLMQRFIVMAVSDMKRPDFNVGDNTLPLKDLVCTSDNERAIHTAMLFSFYVMILCKLIMCEVLEAPSEDASQILLKEIYSEFTRRTRISTEHPRKRKMVADIARILCYMEVVHRTIFGFVSTKYNVETDVAAVGNGNGALVEKTRYKEFTPDILVLEGGPRLFVTDEHVVFATTATNFMFDPGHRYRILNAVVRLLNTDVTTRQPFALGSVHFRSFYNRSQTAFAARHGRHHGNQGARHLQIQGVSAQLPALTRGGNNNNDNNNNGAARNGTITMANMQHPLPHADDEDDNDAEVSPYLVDPRYVVFTGANPAATWARISAVIKHERPAPIEVIRALRELSNVYYKAHPAKLTFVPDASRPAGSAPPASPSPPARPMTTASPQAPLTSLFTSLVPSIQALGGGGGGSNSSSSMQSAQRAGDAPVLPSEYIGNIPLNTIKQRRRDMFTWSLDTDAPPTDEPIVYIVSEGGGYEAGGGARGGGVGAGGDASGGGGGSSRPLSVAVLLEYVINECHENALLDSITHVLGNNTIANPEGKLFLTGMPYLHVDPVTGEEEMMPQFFRTLRVMPSERDFIVSFVQTGTLESNTFIRSSLRFGGGADDDSSISREFASKAGMVFTPGVDINEYFAGRHFTRIGLDLKATKHHQAFVCYTPAVESEQNRRIMAKVAEQSTNVVLIDSYPEDCVNDLLVRRQVMANYRNAKRSDLGDLFVESGDMMMQIVQIQTRRTTTDDSISAMLRPRESQNNAVSDMMRFSLSQRGLEFTKISNNQLKHRNNNRESRNKWQNLATNLLSRQQAAVQTIMASNTRSRPAALPAPVPAAAPLERELEPNINPLMMLNPAAMRARALLNDRNKNKSVELPTSIAAQKKRKTYDDSDDDVDTQTGRAEPSANEMADARRKKPRLEDAAAAAAPTATPSLPVNYDDD